MTLIFDRGAVSFLSIVSVSANSFAMGKGKRTRKSHSSKSHSHGKKRKSKSSMVVPGYTRTMGAYGRALPCGPEKKFFETVLGNIALLGAAGTAVGSSSCYSSLCLVPGGSKDTERVGNLICVKNFNFRGHVEYASAISTNPQNCVRIVFYWDLQTNGSAATIGDLFYCGAAGTLTTRETDTFRNLDQVARFKIIKDKTFYFSPTAYSGTNAAGHIFPLKVNWKGDMPVHFSGTTGAITELKSENVSWTGWSDGADSQFLLAGTARIKFTDL